MFSYSSLLTWSNFGSGDFGAGGGGGGRGLCDSGVDGFGGLTVGDLNGGLTSPAATQISGIVHRQNNLN